jgi:hypothetical protein
MDLLVDSWMILAALLPSIGLLFLFWVILKHIVEGDRRERAALREWEAARDAERAENPGPEETSGPSTPRATPRSPESSAE